MKIKYLKLKISLLILLPFMFLLRELLHTYPGFTEKYYSRLIYPPIGKTLSLLTGILPFSLAELLVLGVVLGVLFLFLRLLYRLLHTPKKLNILLNSLLNGACILSVLYCLFLLLWGFNYYRQPLAYSLDYRIEKSTVADLKALCETLIDNTNKAREKVAENTDGVMTLQDNFRQLTSQSRASYLDLSRQYPIFGGSYGRAKGVFLSWQLCYTGIAGIYVPFTGEANVNTWVSDSMLPVTLCHEMAHQRGFAREDEANFIGYLVCKNSGNADFQYSGYLLAAIYSMNALYEYDPDSYKELSTTYSDGVKRDLRHDASFWKQFEGPAEKLQEKVNDTYLKSNKQSDGIHSYGRMVDLLLAEYKER